MYGGINSRGSNVHPCCVHLRPCSTAPISASQILVLSGKARLEHGHD